MNQVVKGMFLKDRLNGSKGVSARDDNPVAAAAAAIERCMAQAHEAGDEDSVRLLHAVNAILTVSPRP